MKYSRIISIILAVSILLTACSREVEEKAHVYGVSQEEADAQQSPYEKDNKCLSHVYEQTEYTSPTCKEEGSKKEECTICGNILESTIPATNEHDWKTETIQEATEDVPGVERKYCTVCGEETHMVKFYEASAVAEEAMSNVVPVMDVQVQQSQEWTEEEMVQEQTPVYIPETPGHTHQMVAEVVEAVGCNDGYTRHYCSECGYTEADTDFVEAPHSYETFISFASCFSEGWQLDICSECGKQREFIAPQWEHVEQTDHRDPSCSAPGYDMVYCSRCFSIISQTDIPMVDHDYQIINDLKPMQSCSGCGQTEYRPDLKIDQYAAAYRTLDYANNWRSEEGAEALTIDGSLMSIAERRAQEIAAQDRFNHSGMCTWGENIAFGYNSCADVMAGWRASEGHFQNIMNPEFTLYGFGYYVGDDGYVYCVQVFM